PCSRSRRARQAPARPFILQISVWPPKRRRFMRPKPVARPWAGGRNGSAVAGRQRNRGPLGEGPMATPPRSCSRLQSRWKRSSGAAEGPPAPERRARMTTRETQGAAEAVDGGGVQTLTVVDNRTGRTYELPITDGTIRAVDLRQIRVDDDDFGLMTYDPAFMNTASCRSAVTYLDGDRGMLRYRGYPIQQLPQHT